MKTLSASQTEAERVRRHVRQVVTRSGSSFLWGMRVLPRPRREAMYAIYAFCREIDDIAILRHDDSVFVHNASKLI